MGPACPGSMAGVRGVGGKTRASWQMGWSRPLRSRAPAPDALLLPPRRKSAWVESTPAWGLGDLGPCPSPLGDFSSLSLAVSST